VSIQKWVPSSLVYIFVYHNELDAGAKVFVVSIERNAETVRYVSPKTGTSYDYTWQPRQQRWFHAAAPHFIEDILTRDLMYFAKGVPAF
jgi:hypothetical protein